jgi:hypothetical protein
VKIDWNTHDGLIVLAASPRHGTWANQTVISRRGSTRSGGQAPVEASAHTLLTIALTTALRSVTRNTVAELLDRRHGATKPSIMVVTEDQAFAQALQSRVAGDRQTAAKTKLRSGKQFLDGLLRQIARFDLTFAGSDSEGGYFDCVLLKDWALASVQNPKALTRVPPIFVRSAISQRI